MNKPILLSLFFSLSVMAGPVLQMNKAFNSMSGIMPLVLNEKKFKEKDLEKSIAKGMDDLVASMKLARHDTLIKHDLFAPSYALITQNLKQSADAFKKGKKDYALWSLRETLSLCLECHSKLPTDYPSSFQNGELQIDQRQWKSPYDLGMAQLIVRRYVDAKASFTRSIQDKVIIKDEKTIHRPLEQILFIQTRILKDPQGMIVIIDDYLKKDNLPPQINNLLRSWKKGLLGWKDEKYLGSAMSGEKDLKDFIARRLLPLKKMNFHETNKTDLLLASGILSTYFFENQTSSSSPDLSFWLGWIEKRLKRDQFLTSGDLYLKQCIRKYPSHPITRECLKEYKESLEFDFSGSGGTFIPDDLQKEYDELKKLVK